MKINVKKTKLMVFNMSKKYAFTPKIWFVEYELLKMISLAQLLGL